MTAYPITVPLHVAAALRPGETAECDLDTGEWYATPSHGRRELRRPLNTPTTTQPLAEIRRMKPRLRPLTSASTTAFRSRVREMSPNDHVPLDEMRRFYERGGAAS